MSGCQYEMLELHTEYAKDGHVVGVRVRPAGLCLNRPEKGTDWCKEHAYVHELLQAAQEVGYPEMVITTTWNRDTRKQEPALTVGKGLNGWEAYAPRHQQSRHESVMEQLAKVKARNDEASQKAVERAVAKAVKNAA